MRLRLDRDFLALFIFVSLIFFLASLYYYHKSVQPDGSTSWIDFRVYYYAGLRLDIGSNIYDLNDGYFLYKYSPIFALIMSVIRFSTVTLAGALRVWYLILFIALLLSLYLVKEILFYPEKKRMFGFFDIVPFLFVFRYLFLINFLHSYLPSEWPLSLRIFDVFLLCVAGPLFALNLFVIRGKTKEAHYLLILTLAVLFILRFVVLNIDRAQVNLIILLLLLFFVYYLFGKKDITAGLYLGIAMVFKLTPFIFLIYLLLKKRFRALASSIATFVALLLLPSVRWGFERNRELLTNWMGSLKVTLPSEYLQHKNQSLMAAVSRFFSENSETAVLGLNGFHLTTVIAAIYAAFMCVLIYATLKRSGNPEKSDTLYDLSLFFIAMTVLSPVGTKTTFAYTLLPVSLLIKEVFRKGLTDKLIDIGLLFCVAVIYLNSSDIIGDFSTVLHNYSLLTWCLLLLFALLIRAKFNNPSRKHLSKSVT